MNERYEQESTFSWDIWDNYKHIFKIVFYIYKYQSWEN